MSTRRAAPGSTLNQSRFASSPDIDRGLLGNLVAIKCATVECAEDRELLYWLQAQSHTPGGLAGLAAEVLGRFLASNPDPYVVIQQAKAGLEIEESQYCKPLDESSWMEVEYREEMILRQSLADKRLRLSRRQQEWVTVRDTLPEFIAQLCLDPKIGVGDVWPAALPQLCSVLREIKAEREARAAANFPHTKLSRIIWRTLEDAREFRNTTLLHGGSGNGKGHAAEGCCAAYPGRARYVHTPSGNDDTTLLREIANSLGVASGSSTVVQMKRVILAMLKSGDITLVLDSAQNLFPVCDYRYALPKRLDFILNELCEHGVPVVMIGNSSLFSTLGFVEARTGWNRDQFVNQLCSGGVVDLPAGLDEQDVQTVAAAMLPESDRAARKELAGYMIGAPGYLHAGQTAALRARRLAASHKRERVTLADMKEALDRMVPAQRALEAALERADAAKKSCGAKTRNWRPDTAAQVAAGKNGGKRRNPIVTSSDLAAAPAPTSLPSAGQRQRPGSATAVTTIYPHASVDTVPTNTDSLAALPA